MKWPSDLKTGDDSNGVVLCNYYYDAWGKGSLNGPWPDIMYPDFIGNINPFRYRGYYYDTETGLYLIGPRYYDPEVGRFINPDNVSVALMVEEYNLYAYCKNNPMMFVDHIGYYAVPNFTTPVASGFDLTLKLMMGLLGAASKMQFAAAAASAGSISVTSGINMTAQIGTRLVPNQLALANAGLATKNLSAMGKIAKTAKVIGYAALAIDCGISIYNNFSNPYLSMDRKITDSIVDVGFSIGGFLLATKTGALVGTAIGGPIGTVVGALAGATVGVGIWAFQTYMPDEYNSIKVAFNTYVT